MALSPIIFMDTETTGLHPTLDDIWEWAAIRREPDGEESRHHFFVEHDKERAELLDDSFRADYMARYDPSTAVTQHYLCAYVEELCGDRPHIIGAVPSFDTTRLSNLHRRVVGDRKDDPWHYHLGDVENIAVGYLQARYHPSNPTDAADPWGHGRDWLPPWDSKALSRALGVEPGEFAQHTAMGDVEWVRAMWDAMFASV